MARISAGNVGGEDLNEGVRTAFLEFGEAEVAAAFRAALDELSAIELEVDRLQAGRARALEVARALGRRLHVVPDERTAKAAEFTHRSVRAEIALAIRASE